MPNVHTYLSQQLRHILTGRQASEQQATKQLKTRMKKIKRLRDNPDMTSVEGVEWY